MQIITFVYLYERSTDISTVFALHSAAWHFASRPFECRPEIRNARGAYDDLPVGTISARRRKTPYKRIRIAENHGRRMDSLRGYHPESPQCGQRVPVPLHRNSESEDSGQSAASRIPALVLPFIRGRYRKKRTDEGRSESGRWQPPIGKSKPGFGITALRSASGKTGSTTLPHKLINYWLTMNKAIFSLLIAGFLSACSPQPASQEKTLYVSILPIRSLVKEIVGEDFRIEVLVPPGASPETFEPTPRQFIGLNEAQLVFNVGLLEFETALLDKIEDRTKIVDLSRGIVRIEGSCAHAGRNGSDHAHGVDPHVWTSPRALQRMAENAYEAIHAHWPDSAKYTANHARLQEELRQLDLRTAEKIARSGIRYFITVSYTHLTLPTT